MPSPIWWTLPILLTACVFVMARVALIRDARDNPHIPAPPVWTTLSLRRKRATLDWGDAVFAFFCYIAGAALAIAAWIVYLFLM